MNRLLFLSLYMLKYTFERIVHLLEDLTNVYIEEIFVIISRPAEEMPGSHLKPRVSLLNLNSSFEEDLNNNDMNNNWPSSPSSDSNRSSVLSHGTDTTCTDSDFTDPLFSPSLSSQRHSRVLEILQDEQVTTLLDTGCNNCKFLILARRLESLTYLAGVDIDRQILETHQQRIYPLAADFLSARETAELVVELWTGDVTDWAGALVMSDVVEAVTSIEIIEHLDRFDQFSKLVLK